jgi:hypothetical protein
MDMKIANNVNDDCSKCGRDGIRVEHRYRVRYDGEKSLECTCDNEKENAYREVYRRYVQEMEWGRPDAEGDVEREDVECEDIGTDTIEREVNCPECIDDARDQDFEHDEEDPEVDEESEEWVVCCEKCGHEEKLDIE